MKIDRLLIGTGNKAKVKEWSRFLNGHLDVDSISSVGDFPDPEESGDTFEENAIQKAVFYARKSGEIVFSEDGGYEVDVLDGAPGVRSRRILPGGEEGTDDDLIEYVLEKVEGLPEEKRGVSLTCAAAISDPEGNIIYKGKESLRGVITEDVGKRIEGYPFRSIHFIPELGKIFSELNDKEHEKVNHKLKIAERMIEDLKQKGFI